MADKYYIAKGKSISISRGMVGPGEEVRAEDLQSPVSAKNAAAMSDQEILKLKQAQFKLLVESEKGILTKMKPEAPKDKVIELDLRPDVQEVPLTEPVPEKKSVGAGAKKK